MRRLVPRGPSMKLSRVNTAAMPSSQSFQKCLLGPAQVLSVPNTERHEGSVSGDGFLLIAPSGPLEWESRKRGGRGRPGPRPGVLWAAGSTGLGGPGVIQPRMHFPLLHGTACTPGKRLPSTDIRGSPKPAGGMPEAERPAWPPPWSRLPQVHAGSSCLQPVRKA